LIISGINKLKIKEAIKKISQLYTPSLILNIGIAGSTDKSLNIGDIFEIGYIYDIETQKEYKLSNLSDCTLSTSNIAIDKNSSITTQLVDMEASEFFINAKIYIDKKHIHILKIVSDYLDTTIPTKEFVYKLIKNNISTIRLYLDE